MREHQQFCDTGKLFIWNSYLTKNANINRYKYSGYGIGFDRHKSFSFGNGVWQ